MSANRKRRVHKNLYLSAVEWAQVSRRMRVHGFTNFSAYAREALTRGRIEVVTRPATNHALLAELGRIGNNINQIARRANETSSASVEVSLRALELLDEVRRLVAEEMDSQARAFGDSQDNPGQTDPPESD